MSWTQIALAFILGFSATYFVRGFFVPMPDGDSYDRFVWFFTTAVLALIWPLALPTITLLYAGQAIRQRLEDHTDAN